MHTITEKSIILDSLKELEFHRVLHHIARHCISEPGKEHEAIQSGVIDFTGSKPINPSGGLIGVGHPVGASGVRMMLDLYKQVTGQAGGYQVKGAQNGLMLNIGGSATTNMVFILGR